MIERKGELWWPEADRHCKAATLRGAVYDVPAFLLHVKGRDCIVQAGGNVGVYSIVLSEHFKSVVTVEPDDANYEALRLNVEASRHASRITHLRAALGAERGRASVDHMQPDNCGAHRLRDGDEVPVITIDSLALHHCDAIWLDIEGYELPALKGAERTIERFSPVIAIEEKGLSEHFGVAMGEAGQWLEARGYRQVAAIGRDQVFKRGEQ